MRFRPPLRLRPLLERLALAPPAPGANNFHAFISYSHAADGKLAPALQRGLQRFAKPWYRLRALRVFRDEASLSANPHLWSSIQDALGGSEHFVLLASPEAKASPWVAQEVDFWRTQKSPERLLLALTDGEIAWDHDAREFDWPRATAVPEALKGVFAEVPRWIDLRWARGKDELSLSYPQFRDAIAELAAPIHGKPKDEIASEEVRQHRRTVRIARAAALSLVSLTGAAVFFAVFAVQQRDSARKTARVERATRLATSAVARSAAEPELALLAAIEALRQDDSTEVRSAFTRVLEERGGRIVGFGDSSPLGFSADGRFFAVHIAAGEVQVRRSKTGVLVWRGESASSQTAVASTASVSADGRQVALDSSGLTEVYSRTRPVRLPIASYRDQDLQDDVLRTAFLNRRELVVLVGRGSFGEPLVQLRAETWDLSGKRRIRSVELPLPAARSRDLTAFALSADGRRAAVLDRAGVVHVVDTQTGDEAGQLALGSGVIALDGDGSRFAWRGDDGKVVFSDLVSGRRLEARAYAKRSGADAITLSANGRRAVGWWVANRQEPTQAFLQAWNLDDLALGLRWTPRTFANRPMQAPTLDATGGRLLAPPNTFGNETVLFAPEPGRAVAEGVAEHALAVTSNGVAAAGASRSSSVVRRAGVRLFHDLAVDSDSVEDLAARSRGGVRVIQQVRGAVALDVLDLPGGDRRRLVPPRNKAALFARGIVAGDAVVGWDDSCHFCPLAQLYVWDATTGKRRGKTLGGTTIRVGTRAIQFGGVKGVTTLRLDGRLLAAALLDTGRASGRNDLFLIDPESGALARRIDSVGPFFAAGPIAASPSGRRLAVTAPRGGIAVLDSTTGRTLVPPVRPVASGEVKALRFAGDERLVVLYGNSLVVLDPSSGRQLGAAIPMRAGATDVVADPVHHQLVVRVEDSAGGALVAIPDLVLADAGVETLARAGCATLGRNLTLSEWDGLFPGRRRHRTCPSLPADDPGLKPIYLR